MTSLPIHPDDLLFFNEVATAMRSVAKAYELPLRGIEHLTMPPSGMADRMGECHPDGRIRLVLRCSVDGKWEDSPVSPKEVWDTAAHELAHLRHMNHGLAFQEFMLEMAEALSNRQEDHQAKVLRRLVKLQASRDGEAAIGNAEAAEAFAGMINKMLIEYELNPSDIDYARAQDNDPVIEVEVSHKKYNYPQKKMRIAWEESLARVVAKAHLCTYLIVSKSNRIIFVGTKSHATVAEYVYGTLLPIAARLADDEYYDYHMGLRREGKDITLARGFRPAWLTAFVQRIAERFLDARDAATSQAPEGTSTALLRLDGALVKAKRYVDNKFISKASSLNENVRNHHDGRAWGRAAADRMTLGRRGVAGSNTKGYLK